MRRALLTCLIFLNFGCGQISKLDSNLFQSASSSSSGAPTPEPSATPTGTPRIEYFGRFDFSNSAGPIFSWSGSAIRANFHGASVSVTLKNASSYSDEFFTVEIDGVQTSSLLDLTPGQTLTTKLASWTAVGDHQVLIVRNNENNVGHSQFLGFDFGAGGWLLAPVNSNPKFRIEFYGDSITAGASNYTPNCSTNKSSAEESAYETYGFKTARLMGAPPPAIIAWSGYGVFHDNSQDPPSGSNPAWPTLPMIYNKTLDANSANWDFAQHSSEAPNVVVINLGTNDESKMPSTGAFPTASQLQSAYISFAQTLRSTYPKATLLFTVGGSVVTSYNTPTQNAVTALNNSGDKNIYFFQYNLNPSTAGFAGCDGFHPSMATHTSMANQLVSKIHNLGF